MTTLKRRSFLASSGTSVLSASLGLNATASSSTYDPQLIKQHDEKTEHLLQIQNLDLKNQWCGGYTDGFGIHHSGSGGALLETFATAYLNSQSAYHKNSRLLERMQLAVDFLQRNQSPQGNIDLLSTNFNSPPDTGFVVHHVARAAHLGHLYHEPQIVEIIKPFLLKAGEGLATGGIHTPNHRWVVCAALSQIHELFPSQAYINRIEQWLAEGIDIDEDGQFAERSTTVYNAVCDKALVTIALKLNKPELLDAVRKNVESMRHLLHSNGEVVTEISRRQDINTRGTMSRYWFALRMMAHLDQNGHYVSMLQHIEPQNIRLSALMEYPELQQPLPQPKPLPDNFTKSYTKMGVTRIRRGKTSATIIHKDYSRFFMLRRGDAVINAVRFASAFFGKGQFVPQQMEESNGVYRFTQSMSAPYYQPFEDPQPERIIQSWGGTRSNRKHSEVCHLTYNAEFREINNGFELNITAEGTDRVPLSIEINFREGGTFEGVTQAPASDSFILEEGNATYSMGSDIIRFGPGHSEHQYTQIRGAESKLPGPSVYITGFTPFAHTMTFTW